MRSSGYLQHFAKYVIDGLCVRVVQRTHLTTWLDALFSMQDHDNLLAREEEREMLPLCADQGIGTIANAPSYCLLARYRSTRTFSIVTSPSSIISSRIGSRRSTCSSVSTTSTTTGRSEERSRRCVV